ASGSEGRAAIALSPRRWPGSVRRRKRQRPCVRGPVVAGKPRVPCRDVACFILLVTEARHIRLPAARVCPLRAEHICRTASKHNCGRRCVWTLRIPLTIAPDRGGAMETSMRRDYLRRNIRRSIDGHRRENTYGT